MRLPVERKRFMVGKYEVIAQPLAHSVHTLRYTVYLQKMRIGSMVSVPTESDCRFLEKPPVVPPLKIFYVTHRPGRPKKDANKHPVAQERNQPAHREALPPDVSLDGLPGPEDR
jgi:hypothetical protein